MLYMNIEGLITAENNKRKLNYLSECSEEENIQLIILNESHLNPNIIDEEINIPNFTVHRSDRSQRKCGGVAIYLKEPMKAENIIKFTNSTCELLMCYVSELDVHLICVYRPPKTPNEKLNQCLSEIRKYLQKVPPSQNILFIGDLNFPFLKWSETNDTVIHKVVSGATCDDQAQAESLIDLTDQYFLNQVISDPTRLNNTIDLAFTNNSDVFSNFKVEKVSTYLSDHNRITADMEPINSQDHNTAKKLDKLRKFNYWSSKAKWAEMNNYLQNIQWEQKLTSGSTVQSDTDELYEQLYIASTKFIPTKKSTQYKGIPPDRKKLFRRSKFLKRKQLSTSKENKLKKISEELINIQTKLLKSHEAERLQKESNIIKGVTKNSKLFFSYAKKCKKAKNSIGPLKDALGNLISDPKLMCEVLKSQYEKSFNDKKNDIEVCISNPQEYEINLSDLFPDHDESPFTYIDITNEDILQAIKSTKINSAPGPDSVPAILLHKCAETLLSPLKTIMKKSLENSDIPESWKEANITPIYKGKGDKSDPSQYRPISLTSQIIKLLERIIRLYIIHYLESNNLLPESQHGFRPNRSTVSQLLEQYEQILEALASKHNLDIIMLDYAKAFDKINHSILLFKLKKLGISGKLGNWIGNFLLNRSQKVSIDGHSSTPSSVISGVPQGTILGPVLFLVYIADIGDNIKTSTLSSYADDSKIHKIIKSLQDGLNLQLDVKTLYEWTQTNLMEFNSTKFEVLKIGDNVDLKKTEYRTPEGNIIEETTLTKDLGVHFNSKGDFSDHIQIKKSKAKQISGYIMRTFLTRKIEPMMLLFKSLVLPIIDYSSIVWSPHKLQEISMLESVQRYYTSKLEDMENLDYYERLRKLKMYSCQRRRDRYSLLYIFKIIQCKVPNPGISYKWSPRRGKVLAVPPVLSSRASRGSTLLHHSFTRRAPRLFNSLPQSLRNLPDNISSESLKQRVDNFLKNITDEPRIPGYHPTNSASSNRLEDQILALECHRMDHQ